MGAPPAQEYLRAALPRLLELFRAFRRGVAALRRRGVAASGPFLFGSPSGCGAALIWQPSGLRAARSPSLRRS